MTAGLPSLKNVLTPLTKSVSIPPGLSGRMSATDVIIQKKLWIRHNSINNFKWRNGRYYEYS